MSRQTILNLKVALVILAVLMVGMQTILDPQERDIHKGERTPLAGLSNEFILGPMLGIQQAIAGLLWVRADEFFHEGDYDAILPIVRMVTWLDPHQLDVYITGAWHMSYNFTDSFERSDRRYIPAAQKLLEEGYENNKNVYDIPFELGWENTDKIKNYDKAEYWYNLATGLKSQNPENGRADDPAPMFVWHQLAHSYERLGMIDKAVEVWRHALDLSDARVKAHPNDFSVSNVRDSERHNLELDLKRKFSRYTHGINWEVDSRETKSIDPKTGAPIPPNAYMEFEGANAGKPRSPEVYPPWDAGFDCRVTFPQSKVMQLNGTFNVGDGARVTVRLADEKWRANAQVQNFTYDVDQSQTIMIDQHSVRDATWGRKVDMSKDPKMYSFKESTYYLVLEFNPRGTSPFIQDRFGWNGEGLTDKKYLWTVKSTFPGSPDYRILRKVYKLSKEQILGEKPVTDADVVPNAVYDQNPQLTGK